MKIFVIMFMAAFLLGCATPSKIIEEYTIINDKPVLTKKITEYKNSTFHSGKAVGLSIGVNPDTKIPEIILRYGRWESARVRQGMWYDSDYGLNDVNLLTGTGSASHRIRLGDTALYAPLMLVPPKEIPK